MSDLPDYTVAYKGHMSASELEIVVTMMLDEYRKSVWREVPQWSYEIITRVKHLDLIFEIEIRCGIKPMVTIIKQTWRAEPDYEVLDSELASIKVLIWLRVLTDIGMSGIHTKTRKKKKGDHVGFRNGNPFCYNCGTEYKVSMPQPVTMYVAILTQFEKDHIDCEKTWTQPEPDTPEEQTLEKNAMWWLENGERGVSSETMLKTIWEKAPVILRYKENHPCDPSDFRRCHLLLKAVPQLWAGMHKMKELSPQWRNLVDNWSLLTDMLEEQMATNKSNGMYEFMKKLGC